MEADEVELNPVQDDYILDVSDAIRAVCGMYQV